VDDVLSFVRSAAPDSRLVFTYVHRDVIDRPADFPGTRHLRRSLGRMREPWTFGIDPAELPAYLGARGLELIEDRGTRELRADYWGPRGRHLHGYEFYRVALARVAGAV
jgi:O-methyltransferase involved in polyketide biosynthesis